MKLYVIANLLYDECWDPSFPSVYIVNTLYKCCIINICVTCTSRALYSSNLDDGVDILRLSAPPGLGQHVLHHQTLLLLSSSYTYRVPSFP